MTMSTVAAIMDRIELATFDSPIAVFRCGRSDRLDAVPANTLVTQRRIAQGDPDYVGTFTKSQNPDRVRGLLTRALRGVAA